MFSELYADDQEKTIAPTPFERIHSGDLLIVEGTLTDILRVKEEIGLEIKPEFELRDTLLEPGNVELFEVMVMRDSRLVGQTMKTVSFRQTYDLTVLAINRHGETFFKKLSDVVLKFGDVLLVQGDIKRIEPFVVEGEMTICSKTFRRAVCASKKDVGQLPRSDLFLGLVLLKVVTNIPAVNALTGTIEVPLTIAVSARRSASVSDKNRPLRRTLHADRFPSARA